MRTLFKFVSIFAKIDKERLNEINIGWGGKMKNQPIGFLDSGVGGLTVVKEVMDLLPNEEIYYIGDSARNPYGPRPLSEVLEYTLQLANFLVSKGIKLLVIACNTATVAALDVLQERLSIPVIGVIESGTKAAIRSSQNKNIGVIGTEGTIQSNEYEKQIMTLLEGAKVQSVACPQFVSIVEKHQYEDELAKKVVSQELEPFLGSKMDTLILGCTHYPLLQNIIQDFFGDDLTLIDPGIETSKLVQKMLKEYDMCHFETIEQNEHKFYTTGESEAFNQIAIHWLKRDDFEVTRIAVEELEKYGE